MNTLPSQIEDFPDSVEHEVFSHSHSSHSGQDVHNLQTNSKPIKKMQYICHHPGCGKEFCHRSSLNRHLACHNGYQAFQCPYSNCKKRFAKMETLIRHIKIHKQGLANLEQGFDPRLKKHAMLKQQINNETRSVGGSESISQPDNSTGAYDVSDFQSVSDEKKSLSNEPLYSSRMSVGNSTQRENMFLEAPLPRYKKCLSLYNVREVAEDSFSDFSNPTMLTNIGANEATHNTSMSQYSKNEEPFDFNFDIDRLLGLEISGNTSNQYYHSQESSATKGNNTFMNQAHSLSQDDMMIRNDLLDHDIHFLGNMRHESNNQGGEFNNNGQFEESLHEGNTPNSNFQINTQSFMLNGNNIQAENHRQEENLNPMNSKNIEKSNEGHPGGGGGDDGGGTFSIPKSNLFGNQRQNKNSVDNFFQSKDDSQQGYQQPQPKQFIQQGQKGKQKVNNNFINPDLHDFFNDGDDVLNSFGKDH